MNGTTFGSFIPIGLMCAVFIRANVREVGSDTSAQPSVNCQWKQHNILTCDIQSNRRLEWVSEENVWQFGEMLCAVAVEAAIQYKVLNCDSEKKTTKFHLRRLHIVSIYHLQTTDSDFGH